MTQPKRRGARSAITNMWILTWSGHPGQLEAPKTFQRVHTKTESKSAKETQKRSLLLKNENSNETQKTCSKPTKWNTSSKNKSAESFWATNSESIQKESQCLTALPGVPLKARTQQSEGKKRGSGTVTETFGINNTARNEETFLAQNAWKAIYHQSIFVHGRRKDVRMDAFPRWNRVESLPKW